MELRLILVDLPDLHSRAWRRFYNDAHGRPAPIIRDEALLAALRRLQVTLPAPLPWRPARWQDDELRG